MSFIRPVRALAAAGLTAALAATVLSPSTAAAPTPKPIAKDLLSPLSVEVNHRDYVFYSQNFAGELWVKKPAEAAKRIYSSPVDPENGPAEVGGISSNGDVVFFISGTKLIRRGTDKSLRTLADLAAVEEQRNPDGDVTYGATGLSEECAAAWPEEGPPLSYEGIVESHPYATAYHDGSVYVADAAANAIFRYRAGKVTTVAVLPPTVVTVTEDNLEALGFPDCAVGAKYRFEGVPTDVEVHGGKLFVTTLPGGPEDGTAPGSVYKMNPDTGNTVRIATGLVSANGLAVARDGNIYVSELFAGMITRISPSGAKQTFVETALPGAVEVRGTRLFVTENVLSGLGEGEPEGKVTRYLR